MSVLQDVSLEEKSEVELKPPLKGEEEIKKLMNKRYEAIYNKAKDKNRRPVLVLSLDGGGLRGILTCQILKYLEEQLDIISRGKIKNIQQAFDVISGTSTGGFLAVGLGRLNFSVQQCEDLYWEIKKRGWVKTWSAFFLRGLEKSFTVSYNRKRLEEVLSEHINGKNATKKVPLYDRETDDPTKNKAKVSCVVTCYCNGTIFPMLFRTYKHWSKTSSRNNYQITDIKGDGIVTGVCSQDISLLDAALSSGAAPSYFEPKELAFPGKDGKAIEAQFIDGGVSINHPYLLAAVEAKSLWPNRDIFVLSIGTGTTQKIKLQKLEDIQHNSKAVQKPLSAIINSLDSKEFLSNYTMKVMKKLGKLDFKRINPQLKEGKTDMSKEYLMEEWKRIGQEYLNKKKKTRFGEREKVKDNLRVIALILAKAQQTCNINLMRNPN